MEMWPEHIEFAQFADLFERPVGELRDKYGLVRIHAVTEEAVLEKSKVHGNEALWVLDPVEHKRLWQAARQSGNVPVILLPFRYKEAQEDQLLALFHLTPDKLHARVQLALKKRVPDRGGW